MIYSLFFEKLYSITKNDPTLHQTLPNHLTCLMDEFYNVTLPDAFVGLTSTMRSRGISVVIIIQNLLQLKDKFPQNDQDKNLRSNMSTTIILGGPDNESCKTLSEEFGKHTIHKQTTGLTRGGQGSSSENEDVIEHYLFPAQDIYNMAKDGYCAIKVKGTNPLWVDKVRFENSPLCPLLTRKKPYTVRRKIDAGISKYEYEKSCCEQLPEVLVGKEASEYLKQCGEAGVKIINLNELDLGALERQAAAQLAEIKSQLADCDAGVQKIKKALEDAGYNFDTSDDQYTQIVDAINDMAGKVDSLTGNLENANSQIESYASALDVIYNKLTGSSLSADQINAL